jgi:hypothetical protein
VVTSNTASQLASRADRSPTSATRTRTCAAALTCDSDHEAHNGCPASTPRCVATLVTSSCVTARPAALRDTSTCDRVVQPHTLSHMEYTPRMPRRSRRTDHGDGRDGLRHLHSQAAAEALRRARDDNEHRVSNPRASTTFHFNLKQQRIESTLLLEAGRASPDVTRVVTVVCEMVRRRLSPPSVSLSGGVARAAALDCRDTLYCVHTASPACVAGHAAGSAAPQRRVSVRTASLLATRRTSPDACCGVVRV